MVEVSRKTVLFFAVGLALFGVGFVYGFNTPAKAEIMGHNGAEIYLDENTIVDDSFCNKITGKDCDVGAGYEPSVCTWYDGKECPEVDGEQYVLVGYSSSQVKCCGNIAASCDIQDWTTIDTYCDYNCGSKECGVASGSYVDRQMRVLDDCLQEYRDVDTENYCVGSCGSCGSEHCNGGTCGPSMR
jgi:hypothetical protein